MEQCSSGKRIYLTPELAEEALIHHHSKFTHREGSGPVNFYECEICGCYHFTSKGMLHPSLKSMKKDLQQAREAHHWEQRIKGRH